ncbi:MAG: hypothetical protein ISEC1_P1082 [Thiomicrorhabdus sp.]|nr:MAG: hypothetical protein ISEC1_P1082 [Thiomicrorhabdus sp.]
MKTIYYAEDSDKKENDNEKVDKDESCSDPYCEFDES